MINLIPPEGTKLVLREYWVRTLSVWALVGAGLCVLVVVLLSPTYVLLSSQLRAVQEEMVETNLGEQYEMAEGVIREVNSVIVQLGHTGSTLDTSGILEEIRDTAHGDIRLNYFQILEEEDASKVQVRGVASTREALATFKTNLEHSPLFESVIVPISDLARESDLPFAITVLLDPLTTGGSHVK